MLLTKHHGLGNDFMVVFDPTGEHPVTPDQARRICDRTRGVGADGVLHVTLGASTDLVMVLLNADGSRAEMSGNGISCVAQAALLHGAVKGPTVTVASDAGVKTLTVGQQGSAARHTVRVDLGPVEVGDEAPDWCVGEVGAARWVEVGNPHLVLAVPDHRAVDLVEVGARANDVVAGGTNVETVVAVAADAISMRVYERGVGLTDACGTGACASAAAAHRWGLVGATVTVHQPGGDAVVELSDTTHYTVEVEAVARIEWPWT